MGTKALSLVKIDLAITRKEFRIFKYDRNFSLKPLGLWYLSPDLKTPH